jgi:hypothetical protein
MAMPIRQFFGKDVSFEPDDLKVMGEALSCALAQLGLYDRNDRIVEFVPRRIVRAALQGERATARRRRGFPPKKLHGSQTTQGLVAALGLFGKFVPPPRE